MTRLHAVRPAGAALCGALITGDRDLECRSQMECSGELGQSVLDRLPSVLDR